MAHCTKIRHASRWAATRALHVIRERDKPSGKPLPAKVYHCRHCLGWHLTSHR